jgi:perosamine synthetase
MSQAFIPVARPVFAGNEKQYILDCLDSTWISSTGVYIDRFESQFAAYCGVKHALSCCNGTVALHLALLACGVGPGDEVLVPTLTFVATANAVTYCGATPVFVDSEPYTWNLDPTLLEARITQRTKAIIAVHLYGHPAEMDSILAIARRHNLAVIEDAAEAHGAEYKGRRVGSLGDIATFSFFGNKIITTGEGGMLTTDNEELATKVRQLKGQGMDPNRRYWFPIIGYNYRMTNITAAIGLAQLEKVDWHLQRRREVVKWYQEELGDVPMLTWHAEQPWAKHVYWMFTAMLTKGTATDRDAVILRLGELNIETRPVFYPMHILPPYMNAGTTPSFTVADRLAARGLNLPTWAGLSRNDVQRVCTSLKACLKS